MSKPKPFKTAMPGRSPEAERLLAGARHHFFAHGFRGVTMDDLAAELRMSKKTLYAHFPSKAALLQAVIGDKLSRLEADLSAAMEGKDFARKLQAMLACMRDHSDEIQSSFVRDMRRADPKLFARIQEGRRKLIHRFFGRLLEEGRKAGMIRKDVATKLLIEILVGAVDAVMVPSRVEELGITPKTGFMRIISVFLEGALTRKGSRKR